MRAVMGLMGGFLLVGCAPSRQSLSAGEVGCRPSEITISDETVGNDGFSMSSENWVAECNGVRFICTQINNAGFYNPGTGPALMTNHTEVKCQEEHSGGSRSAAPVPAPPPPLASAPPKGGAGFELGTTFEAAQAACETAGHTWAVLDQSSATCSGSIASLGFPTAVTLKRCGSVVCGIGLVHKPESDWLDIIAELRNGLQTKYGPPLEREGELHADCRAKGALVACLQSRRARLRYLWSWPSGEQISLLVGIPPAGGDAAIRLDYTKPARASSVNELAL